MSVKVQGWVWDNSKAKLTTLLVALALADHAHHDGTGAYPSITAIAEKARCSERQAQRAIRELERLGEIHVEFGKGPHGSNVYNFTLTGVTPMSPRQIVTPTNATSRGDKSDTEGVTPMSPKPSLRTVIEPSIKTKRVDDTFIASMVEKYQDKYGSEQAVRDEISDALNHKAVDKRKDVQRYVDTWLRRGMPTLATRRNGTHTTSPTSAADDILSHPIFGPRARRQLEQA